MKMQHYEEESRVEGITEPLGPIAVTSETRRVKPFTKPWHSVSIVNDGPDVVYVIVNSEKSFDEYPLRIGETYMVDMHRPCIKDVLMRCEVGGSASARFIGAR